MGKFSIEWNSNTFPLQIGKDKVQEEPPRLQGLTVRSTQESGSQLWLILQLVGSFKKYPRLSVGLSPQASLVHSQD